MCTFELNTCSHIPIELCAFAIVAVAVDGGGGGNGKNLFLFVRKSA